MTEEARDDAPARWVPFLLLGVGIAVLGATLARRGMVLSDEGYVLLQSLDMSRGAVLYRDLDAFVAPGVWFLLAGLFSIFEPSILVSRMAVLVCYLATAAVTAVIAARLAGRRAAWIALVGYAVATVWAFPAWTWSFYSPYAVLFALLGLERLLAWRSSERGRELFVAGLCFGLSIAFKQNYGAQALLGAALALAALRLERDPRPAGLLRFLPVAGLRLGAGVAVVAVAAGAYFVWHGAVADAFRALVIHPFGGFLGQHDIPYVPLSELLERDKMGGLGRLTYAAWGMNHTALRFDWPRPFVRAVELLHVLLYWLPPLVFGLGAALAVRGRAGRRPDGGLAAAVLVGGALFLGVFPRADYNHLVNVYQPVVVVGVVVLARLAASARAWPAARRRGAAAALLLLFAPYAGIAVYWYVDILRTLREPLDMRRGGVLVSLEKKQMLEYEVFEIQRSSAEGEPVLTLPALAMVNFLAERPMPSRFYNHYAVHIAGDGGAALARDVEAEGVDLVLADYNGFFSEIVGMKEYAPELTSYLRRHFETLLAVAIDDHLFLRRRDQPLPERALLNVLEDCDVGLFDWRSRGIQEHLLFDMLYHPLQSGDHLLRRQAETLCRVSVPEQAVLAFAVGYRQPTRVAQGTRLVAEVWLRRLGRPDETPTRVYREEIVPKPLFAWSSPPHLERRVDLSEWGGEDVLLMFRTLYRGDTRMNILDFKGFAMVWQDPQLEHPGGADRGA